MHLIILERYLAIELMHTLMVIVITAPVLIFNVLLGNCIRRGSEASFYPEISFVLYDLNV